MRLLTYNIHKGIGGVDRRYDIERVWRVIEEETPDIVCLQEVTSGASRTSYHDQADILADRFQASGHSFQINVHYDRGGYGNLVLSRWAFEKKHHVCLRMDRRKPRGAQMTIVNTPEGPLHLTNLHLGLVERERHWQTERLLNHPRFQGHADLPSLVVGDFNDWRNTLAEAQFAAHGFEQLTGPPKQFRSFPAFLPMLSLDKAFLRGGLRVRDTRLVRTWRAFWASDHLPLVIDFNLA